MKMFGKVLVIPDIHGKVGLLKDMLAEHGGNAERVIQIGDLANCVLYDKAGDVECIRVAKEHNIECLIGNHEHPYFGGTKFHGFCEVPEVRDAVRSIKYRVATTVGDVLLTHAGVHLFLESKFESAKDAADKLNALWEENPTDPVFNWISDVRYGRDAYGGVLWRDFSEMVTQKFPQVFGHTKRDSVRMEGKAICIDCEKPFIMFAKVETK